MEQQQNKQTLDGYIESAKNSVGAGQTFWRYDGMKSNCQWFVAWCLLGQGLLTSELKDFALVNGNVAGEFGDTAKSLMNAVTDIDRKSVV